MMTIFSTFFVVLFGAYAAYAKQVVVTVGHNTTSNATAVFDPAEIFAQLNDIIIFNFTLGNHTVTQSTFASPCTPAHETNITINGFDSGFRDTVNGTAITILSVPITPDIANTTLWFFDYNTCPQGGVGGININDSSTETLDGFVRNAIRLNGTGLNKTTSPSHSISSSNAPSPTASTSSKTSSAEMQVALGALSVLPLILAALVV